MVTESLWTICYSNHCLMFQMVRHVFKQSLVLLNRKNWNKEIVENWLRIFTTQLLNPKDDKAPVGLKFHVIDIYLDEIAEAGAAEVGKIVILCKI